MLIPEVERDFEWDQTKSDRNRLERQLPFDLAIMLFSRPTLEQPDARRDYREVRTRAIGMIGGSTLACVYTDRGLVRRIISLRPANRRERDDYRAAFQN
ncbi:MAG: BrnT family toxin [Rhodopila sp.]|nr:BrnT family toxin [Rhodopila sp.]